MRGLYVHVPFCEKMCHYCDFNSYPLRDGGVEAYLDALLLEMQAWSRRLQADPPTFDTVFIGGGTPTALTAHQLQRLLREIRRYFSMAAGAEITVEANPGTLTRTRLATLRAGGVNRLSMGAQSLDDGLLERLGRIHRAHHVRECFTNAREAGFDDISLDLMFGLPGQSLAQWKATLAEIADWEPEHLSCYSLIVEEGTPFAEWQAQGRLPLPGEDAELAMFSHCIEFLTRRGYRHYEISNFARPGMTSRHNRIYWQNDEYLGLGPGAHSHWAGERFANVKLPSEYGALLQAGRLPVAWQETVSPQDAMADSFILGLRLMDGVSWADFRRRHGQDAHEVYGREIDSLTRKGLLQVDQEAVRLTAAGLPLANQVFIEFLP